MNAELRPFVLNLPEWELPRFEDQEWPVIDALAAEVRAAGTRSESLKDGLYQILHGRLMELAQSAVNETIEYWLQGLGGGNDGSWPELCVELPYLEHGETTEPLTLAYCVDNADNTRTELNRTTLEDVLARLLEEAELPAQLPGRARVVAGKLRALAQKLEAL
jgi:hypothetical protein